MVLKDNLTDTAAQPVKSLLAMPAPHIRVPVQVLVALPLIQSPGNEPGKAAEETQKEFLVPGFGLAQMWFLQPSGGKAGVESLSLCLSKKCISNKNVQFL